MSAFYASATILVLMGAVSFATYKAIYGSHREFDDRMADMAVTMRARDAGGPSRFASLFGSTKQLSKSSSVFTLKLTPPLTRSPKDLWRLDTSEKYVRGEEALGGWKPRGISVVEDYLRLVSTEKRSADVQAIKVILAAWPPVPYRGEKPEKQLVETSLKLWQKKFGHPGHVFLSMSSMVSFR